MEVPAVADRRRAVWEEKGLQSNLWHYLKAHSRSSLAVLLLRTEQQVWEESLLNQTGCRVNVARKAAAAAAGYSSPDLSRQPENFILIHEKGLLSKCDLSKPGKKGPCANKTRPKLCNQTSSMFKNISGSPYIPLLLAPFPACFSMRGRTL